MAITIQETNLAFGGLSRRSRTNRIIIHHADASVCDAATIHQWHKGNGWAGIGYHFVVRKNGTIQRGRPENTIGAHASGSNSDSIGICFEGAYMTESIPDAQKKAGKELVAYLKAKYGINKVLRHSEVCPTSCPGVKFPFSEIAGVAASSTTVNTTTAGTSYAKEDCLGKGDKGADVRKLQTMLISLGYSCGDAGVDGDFGNGTESAVKSFQKAIGLKVDGLAGKNTITKLRSLYANKKTTENTPVKNDTPKTVKTDNWIARLQAECNAQGFSKQAVDGIKGPKTLAGCPTLKKGASGNITRLLQEKLISLGYNCGSCGADGKFGADTKNAVIAYQKKSGLSADGIVGQNTWRKLLGM